MKKIILSILLFVLFIPFFVNAETCDLDKISISSITIEEKSDNVEELDEATANRKNINLNLSMSDVGDTIVYKIIVKNDSDEDYQFDKNSISINSDYIDYSMESDDDYTIIKANETKEIYLRVEYNNEVPEEKFSNGAFNENKEMVVNLSTGNTISVPDTLKNPNTGVQSYIIILSLLLIISIASYIFLRKKKYMKFMVLIIGCTIIIPISVYAICKTEIKIESNIVIKRGKYVAIKDYGDCSNEPDIELNKINNTTWSEFYLEGKPQNYASYFLAGTIGAYANNDNPDNIPLFINEYSNKIFFIVNDDISCDSFIDFDRDNYSTMNTYYDCSYNNRKIMFGNISNFIFDSSYGYYVVDSQSCLSSIPEPEPFPFTPVDPPVVH